MTVQDPPKDKPKKEEPPKAAEAPQPPKKEEAAPKKKQEDPPKDSERWNQVYGRMKFYERENAEKEKDLEALRNHVSSQQRKLDELTKQVSAPRPVEAPDPEQDPKGYQKWHELQLLDLNKKHQEEMELNRIEMLRQMEKSLHPDDYEQNAAIADRDVMRDPALKKRIYGSDNPFREAYLYGKKMRADMQKAIDDEATRQKGIEQASPEAAPSAPPAPPEEDEVTLTEDEKRVVSQLYVRNGPHLSQKDAEKRYLDQKKKDIKLRGGRV